LTLAANGDSFAFGVLWFLLALGPVIFLPNHVYRYYLVFPVLGLVTSAAVLIDPVVSRISRKELRVRFVGKAEARATAGYMPESPGMAVQKLLEHTGLSMNDMAVVKNHNPFAVNDAIFAKLLDYDWREMNKTGSSLVWGHPQGPTLTRLLIEALEEAVSLGGGYVLLFGCAAGDVGIAALFKVS